MKITVRCEDKRSWEGIADQWEAHKGVIKAWCEGAEIELYDMPGFNLSPTVIPCPEFQIANKYRVKKREPVCGEVWVRGSSEGVRGSIPFLYVGSMYISLDKASLQVPLNAEMTFSASSVKEYFAMEQVK